LHFIANMRKYLSIPDALSFVGNFIGGATAVLTFAEVVAGKKDVHKDPNLIQIIKMVEEKEKHDVWRATFEERGREPWNEAEHSGPQKPRVDSALGLADEGVKEETDSYFPSDDKTEIVSVAPPDGVIVDIANQFPKQGSATEQSPKSIIDASLIDSSSLAEHGVFPSAMPFLLKVITYVVGTQLTSARIAERVKIAELLPSVKALDFTVNSVQQRRKGLDLVITSWANFAFYVDFGASVGKVEWVRGRDEYPVDGFMCIFPRKRDCKAEDEEIEMTVALRDDVMEGLENDEYFNSVRV